MLIRYEKGGDKLSLVKIKAIDNGKGGWVVEEINDVKVKTLRPIPQESWSKFREALELLSQYLVFDWNKEMVATAKKEWSDVELEDYLKGLNLNQKALLYAAAQLKDPTKKELLEKMNKLLKAKNSLGIDERQFTAIKGSLTKHFEALGREELIPSQFTVEEYWDDEKSRYRINEKYREKIIKILNGEFK